VIVYFDASALVKRYVAESGSEDVLRLSNEAAPAATSIISRAEVSAAISRAVRGGVLSRPKGRAALNLFRAHWADLVRVRIDESVVARADVLAWDRGLRGYDAIHLASALMWRESLGVDTLMATFDKQLWEAALSEGFTVWPEGLM
jgi:predicted nucleic acid-binding protein